MGGRLRKILQRILDRLEDLFAGNGAWLRLRFPRYEIGRGTYGWPRVVDGGEGATLRIGAFCSIAKGVQIFLGGEHRTEWITTFPFPVFWKSALHIRGHPKTKGDVQIGNDVWIGQNAMLLSGVTIGDGAVIAAGAVVAGDVEPYTIVAGNPARLIRQRFSNEVIAQLLEIKWWTWSDKELEPILPILLSENIQALIQYSRTRKPG